MAGEGKQRWKEGVPGFTDYKACRCGRNVHVHVQREVWEKKKKNNNNKNKQTAKPNQI